MSERVVTFRNKAGHRLFGILHTPEKRIFESRVGINILNPGLKNRVAPNRINVKMARAFCDMGFYVFRSDPFGIGDSEGELAEHDSIMDLWGMVQRGLFVADTHVANRVFVQEANLDKLLLIGQCGAAVTSILVGAEDDRVESLILVDCSTRLLSSKVDLSLIMAETRRPSEMMQYYLKKVIDGKAWMNLFRLRSDVFGGVRLIVQSMGAFIKKEKGNADGVAPISERFNKSLGDAFCRFMARKKKICFLYAENDFSLKEFQQDMQGGLLANNKQYEPQYQVQIIKDANHVYTEEKWQKDLLQYMKAWLEQYGQAPCSIS